MNILAPLVAALGLALPTALLAGPGPSPLAPPSPEVLAEARKIVQAMKEGERGPYLRIRWFCADGSILPPDPYACRGHGGGIQHAEYSPARKRLAELGWSVGTILAALPWEAFWDEDRRHQRMRELAVERYLVETDDGWVLRKARTYRGRVQVEDEEDAGRKRLLRMLEQRAWVPENFLLAREMVRVLPHHGGSDKTREVRRLSLELAELRKSFEPIRVQIHNAPSAQDLGRTKTWLEAEAMGAADAKVLEKGKTLLIELEALYGPARDWVGEGLKQLSAAPAAWAWATRLAPLPKLAGEARVELLATALADSRALVEASEDPATSLTVLDMTLDVERELMRAALDLVRKPGNPRRRLLTLARQLVAAAHGAGFYSAREAAALTAPVVAMLADPAPGLARYQEVIRTLGRASAWGLGSVRQAFAEPLVRYGALEPRALKFVDDVVRSSVLLPLSELVAALTADLDTKVHRTHRFFGAPVSGVVALNPGVGRGVLRRLDPHAQVKGAAPPRDSIAVLPQTVSDLAPVAGILSLAEGNLLSHVQLLARNLGIPNAFVGHEVGPILAAHEGEAVVLAVTRDGAVLLDAAARLATPATTSPTAPAEGLVEAPRPDLEFADPIPLAELHAGLSGKRVGPKAANLGELARAFPGRVAPALALPFGFFHHHTTAGENPPRARLEAVYARRRGGLIDDATFAKQLEAVRIGVAAVKLPPTTTTALVERIEREFGPAGGYGIFVRSDTNVEDLPGFTGAGLNETVPNLPTPAAALAVVPRVWSSVLTPRSLAWRSAVIRNPEDVWSSVLLMKAVASDKSGVMVTKDLVDGGAGLTVSTAFGVGGAVDGEAAETVVLRPDGSVLLAAEAKAPFRRALDPGGGVSWVPAPAGRVLGDAEHAALRELAREVDANLTPARDEAGQPLPWDIEFGFEGRKLVLFQIRPLIERGPGQADALVAAAGSAASTPTTMSLGLDELVALPAPRKESP